MTLWVTKPANRSKAVQPDISISKAPEYRLKWLCLISDCFIRVFTWEEGVSQVPALKPGSKHAPSEDRLSLEVISLLAPPLASLLRGLPAGSLRELEEIRMRAGQPLLLRRGNLEFTVYPGGKIGSDLVKGFPVTPEAVRSSVEIMTRSSIYAWEDELRNGFLTLRGGHRVGLAGKVVVEGGYVKTVRHISSLNVRIAKEIKGVGRKLLPYLIEKSIVQSALIISPPQAGKTTLLRDLIRILSSGEPEAGLAGLNVGVVDERSELAGCWEGIPQNDLGPRTDVLDCCPKSQGMVMLLRAMSPQVIVTDELGRREDITALEEAVNGGVTVITTVHGQDEQDIKRKPVLRELLGTGVFRRGVVLSRRQGVGTVERVWDPATGRDILTAPLVLRGREHA